MGGTTAKASVIRGGEPDITHQFRVGADASGAGKVGEPVRIPVIDLAEVGAGGGSIAWVDRGGLLHVGPQSAGANPGPACYGLGGHDADRHRRQRRAGLHRSGQRPGRTTGHRPFQEPRRPRGSGRSSPWPVGDRSGPGRLRPGQRQDGVGCPDGDHTAWRKPPGVLRGRIRRSRPGPHRSDCPTVRDSHRHHPPVPRSPFGLRSPGERPVVRLHPHAAGRCRRSGSDGHRQALRRDGGRKAATRYARPGWPKTP